MRHIKKSAPPHELKAWFDGQPESNRDFRNDFHVREPVISSLLKEQGYLCAYTGIQIDLSTSHIEHLYPYQLCRKEPGNRDVDYENLVAAYPKDEQREIGFGAKKRNNWYDKTLFITPLDPRCEQLFKYRLSGKVERNRTHKAAAEIMIEKFQLNHSTLKEKRAKAIKQALYKSFPNKTKSKAHLQRIVDSYDQPNAEGKLKQFCFVITQAAAELRDLGLKEANRRKHQHRAQKSKK